MTAGPAPAAEWRAEVLPTPGPVKAIESVGAEVQVQIGGGWFRMVARSHAVTLAATARPLARPRPAGFLPDGRIAEGKNDIARAWFAGAPAFAGPTLGEAGTSAALAVERRNRTVEFVPAGGDAAFEDLQPRVAALEAKREGVVAVKSHRGRGAGLVLIAERDGRYALIAETPPGAAPGQWIGPAGIADFDGDGTIDIAAVRAPHGSLELWSLPADKPVKRLELDGFASPLVGARPVRMSAVADFDGDGRPDLAIAAADRRTLRLMAFAPQPRELARVPLAAPAATEAAALKDSAGHAAVLIGLENGALVLVRQVAR